MKKFTYTLLGVFLISLVPLFSDECPTPDKPGGGAGEKEKTSVTQPVKSSSPKKVKAK
jgi:hypothetical protein